MSVMPTAASSTPRVHRSWPTPGVLELLDSGTYANQPARPAPSSVSHPDCMTTPPASHTQNPLTAIRGHAMRAAPICRGTRYIPSASAIGVTNR